MLSTPPFRLVETWFWIILNTKDEKIIQKTMKIVIEAFDNIDGAMATYPNLEIYREDIINKVGEL